LARATLRRYICFCGNMNCQRNWSGSLDHLDFVTSVLHVARVDLPLAVTHTVTWAR
jgi:hypothetical protein